MIYIFFNSDGTPNSIVSTTTLTQGTFGVPVYVAVLNNSDFDPSDYVGKIAFKRSDDSISPALTLAVTNFTYNGTTYKGYMVNLNSDWYFAKAGTLQATVSIATYSSGNVVANFAYGTFNVQIQASVVPETESTITDEEYAALLAALLTKLNKVDGIIAVADIDSITEDEFIPNQLYYNKATKEFYLSGANYGDDYEVVNMKLHLDDGSSIEGNITGDADYKGNNTYSGNNQFTGYTKFGYIDSNLLPKTTENYNLGSSSYRWNTVFSEYVYSDVFGTITASISNASINHLTVTDVISNLVPAGATQTLGVKNGYWWAGVYADDAVFTDVDIQGILKTNSGTGLRIEGGLLPKTNETYSIGSATYKWNNLYAKSSYLDSLNANSGELTVGSSLTIIQHLLVQSSMTVPIAPTFSNGMTVSGSITDGSNSWSVADVAGVLALFGSDSDTVVNKINEVLDIFENYPEGDDLITVLATKFDKSSIITSYDSASVSNTTVYSALCTKTAIDTLNSYFGSGGIAYRAFADENGTNLYTYYMKYDDLDVSGGVVVAINNIPVATEVNVSGQPIPVSSTDDMTDETKMYWLTTNGYIYYYDGNSWVQTTQKLFDPSSSLIPAINHDISLGSDSKRWLSGYFNELYVGSEGNNVISIDDELTFLFNRQATFNDGVKIPSGEVLTDGTYSISVEEIVNNKVNVDANVPTLTSGMADNLTPYNENSGDNQTEPFIFQATGTANGNKPDYSTKSYALLQEKQGNSVVVNQLQRQDTYNFTGGSTTFSSGKYTVSYTLGVNADVNIHQTISCKANHKYLIYKNKLTDTANISIYFNRSNPWGLITGTATNGTVIYSYSSDSVIALHTYSSTAQSGTATFECYVVDLTQMYGSNDNIPQALLDNPSLFPLYYSGSLAYNVGEIVNSNARYLDCIDINQWDEEWEHGYYNNNGVKVSGSGLSICSTNLFRIIPNSTYYNKSGGNYFNMFFYDNNRNFIKSQSVNINATFTTPENAYYMAFHLGGDYGTTYKNDICINISNNNINGTYYPYKLLTHLDTGTETLRGWGNLRDVKKPNGVITRKIGSVDLSSLAFAHDGTRWYASASTLGVVLPTSNDNKANIISDKYITRSLNDMAVNGGVGIGIATNGNIYIYDSSSNNPSGTLIFELATPTEEQGTTFSENLVINDYGTMNWNNTSFNGIPMGNLIFYPVDYKAFIDTLYNYSSGTPSNIALKSDVSTEATTRSNQDTILLNAIGGTLRQCLCVKETLDFENTAFIDLGSLNWSYNASYGFSAQLGDAKNIGYDTNAKILSTLYKTNTYVNVAGKTSDMQIALGGYDISQPPLILINNNSYTNATTFKNAMKGVLLAYEKA